ncbi:hypothetical protein AB733_23845 [Photobacterium swingsii]|uniref:Rad50/SbcC-type AAA domain-containing protein n=1 Tax=Photobacterium swingsii TaxID=680026 RepID=A0A0J8V5D3_9GAMM|nr:hypothetical protein [Photobacterium swingsii]KMV28412.1 hypothetical protein AB733_23845 [Photobacterium swingsii]PSW18883.1 hypothetical protein C9I94_24270 [Photobacterium swingsii]
MTIGLKIKKLLFLSDNHDSSISFSNPVHIVHGASNTGKSLLIEAIDYMLGTEKLKQVPESKKYSEVAMQVLLNGESFTVFRKWPSNNFEVYNGLVDSKEGASFYNYFKIGTATKTVNNISDFYLKGYRDTQISSNLYGEKGALTVRLLSRVILSSEEKIIRSDSPIIVGDTSENSKNKNVFKFLLTGNDDSEVRTVIRDKEFKSKRKGQVEVLADVVKTLKSDLVFKDESYESLNERSGKLDVSIDGLLEYIDSSQKALSGVVSEKKAVSNELMDVSERINIIQANLANFETLKDIYLSDIERLNSQEEAAFLLGVGHGGQCDFCGKAPETICKDLIEVNVLAEASKAEIKKIKSKLAELSDTSSELDQQLVVHLTQAGHLKSRLKALDNEAERRAPEIKLEDNSLMALRKERTSIEFDLNLHDRISSFNKKLQEAELAPVPKKHTAKEFYPESEAIDSFCRIYSNILGNIKFPGENNVEFDYKTFDVIIDGNPRNLNGKGVRAILHSVFKIALLMHCRQKEIYHPGIVILDSPLVTYRDPLVSKHGELEEDEEKLAETKISYHFLNYLHKISRFGQFIIVENIDVPESLRSVIGVDTFYGKNAGQGQRIGLL